MQINKLNSAVPNFTSTVQKPKNVSADQGKSSGSSSSAGDILSALAVVGTALGALIFSKPLPVKLSEIDFNKGIASLNGEKFTGTVQDVLKNGDSIFLKYDGGKIVESIRKAPDNTTLFKKLYLYADSGSKEITTFKDNGKIVRHCFYGKDLSGFSIIEENFNNNKVREIARFMQDDDTGAFMRLDNSGKIRVGVKEKGTWHAHVDDTPLDVALCTKKDRRGRDFITFNFDKLAQGD